MSTTVELVRANERYARLRAAVEAQASEYGLRREHWARVANEVELRRVDAARREAGVWGQAEADLRALLAAVDS